MTAEVTLRPYQIEIAQEAVGVIERLGVVMLLMQVRTGKTMTAIHIAQLMNKHNVIFITKKRIISSIAADADAMGVHLTITNYEQLNKFTNGYQLVIVDEFHSFGAFPRPSIRAKALREICKDTDVIMLSGTPSPESYSQFFHPLWATCKGPWRHYKNFYDWAKEYVNRKLKFIYNRHINDYSEAKIERITQDLDPYIIRYTQIEAGFETVVEDKIIELLMPDSVMRAVKILKKDKIFKTKDGEVVLADTAVKMMSKVHQLCSGTVKSEDGVYVAFDDFKARFIKVHFAGQKIAIFYKYIAERTHIENVFGVQHICDTPEEFNSSDHSFIYVSQIQSGREGINLSSARAIIMYNIDFSALSYWQARERMQGLERKMESTVYFIFTEGGIERRIYDMVCDKKDFTLRHFKAIR